MLLKPETISGFPPFFDDNPFGIYEKILSGKIDWPRHMDPVPKDLIKKLLVADRSKRLGSLKVINLLINEFSEDGVKAEVLEEGSEKFRSSIPLAACLRLLRNKSATFFADFLQYFLVKQFRSI